VGNTHLKWPAQLRRQSGPLLWPAQGVDWPVLTAQNPHRQASSLYYYLDYNLGTTSSRETMTSLRDKAGGFWQKFTVLLGLGRGTGPIDGVAALEHFVSTRSAYVAQKTLYGYVKTRMGTRYVAMFEDKTMIASLNIAKMHVFAACLSDLSIYAVATAVYKRAVPNTSSGALARRCFAAGLRDNSAHAPAEFSGQECVDAFDRRLSETDLQHGARQPEIFSQSPAALVRWAPIADNLKKLDNEIIENSVKFAWRDVREQFNQRLDAAAVTDDWMRQSP
jgi:hypothetical protein